MAALRGEYFKRTKEYKLILARKVLAENACTKIEVNSNEKYMRVVDFLACHPKVVGFHTRATKPLENTFKDSSKRC